MSYQFNTAVPIYQIQAPSTEPSSMQLSNAYPMIKLAPNRDYTVYQLAESNGAWVAVNHSTISADDLVSGGWALIDENVSTMTSSFTFMALPNNRHLYNDHFSELTFTKSSDMDIEFEFTAYVDVTSWRYRVNQGEWVTGVGTQASIQAADFGVQDIEVEVLSPTGDVVHTFELERECV